MKCTFTFKIGDKDPISITLETDNGELVLNEDIINVLKTNPEQAEEIFNLIEDRLNGNIKYVSYQDLLKEGNLIANTNVEGLRKNFPDIFPDNVDANVLLVNKIRVGRDNISGRCINSNGEEIFVIENTPEDINRFANYLRVREQIQNVSFKNTNDELLKETGAKDIKSLALDFIENESKYLNKTVTINGKQENCYRILLDITRQLLNKPGMKVFGDPLVDNIYPYLCKNVYWWKDKNNKWVNKDNLHTLDVSFLYNLLCAYAPNVLTENNIPITKSGLEQFKKAIKDNPKIFKDLFDSIRQKFPQFNFIFNPSGVNFIKYRNSDVILLESVVQTAKEQYGWTYDTIKTFDIQESYRGYQIYARNDNGIKEFYFTKDYMTEDSYVSMPFKNINDVRRKIDEKINFIKIPNHNNIDFHNLDGNVIETKQKLIVGSIVEVLNFDINTQISINKFPANEQSILNQQRSKQFKYFEEIVNSWNISTKLKEQVLKEIDTPEKVTLFLYGLQSTYKEERNKSGIENILNKIRKAKPIYYYVDELLSNNRYRIIPTDPSDIDNYRKENKYIPGVRFLEAISKGIKEKIPNVEIHIDTAEQLKEQFPEVDINTTKAFIVNGEIYLNSSQCKATDLLHEYIHLILGMLRSNPDTRENYEKLLYRIVSSNDKSVINTMEMVEKAYPNISQMDKYEEVFANLFSKYFINHNKKIFDSNEIKDLSETIFGQKIDNTEDFYKGSIYKVFTEFNQDIASWLANENEISWSNSKTYRQLSNYISEQIKEGKIKENCK